MIYFKPSLVVSLFILGLSTGCGQAPSEEGSPTEGVENNENFEMTTYQRINDFSQSLLSSDEEDNWKYSYIEGGSALESDRAWINEIDSSKLMIIDTMWYETDKSVFARGDDLNPVVSNKALTYNLQHSDFSPVVEFVPPNSKIERARIKGSLLVKWDGFSTPRTPALNSEVEVVLAKRSPTSSPQIILSKRLRLPSGTSSSLIDLNEEFDLNSGDRILLSIRGEGELAAGATPGAWISLIDEFVIIEIVSSN